MPRERACVTAVAINGLGRIDYAFLKVAMTRQELRVVAVNDLIDPENRFRLPPLRLAGGLRASS